MGRRSRTTRTWGWPAWKAVPLAGAFLAVDLQDAGLVAERVAGTRRIYRLNPAGVAAMRDQLDTYWNRALAGYQDAVASPDDTGEQHVVHPVAEPGQERS